MRRFGGNPAAVCLLDAPREPAWMQRVAAEMNLAETAFLVPSGPARFGLRWFTPVTEVALCGHATLASAHALWSTGRVAGRRSHHLRHAERRAGRAAPARTAAPITIDLPARDASESPLPEAVARALGVTPIWTGVTVKRNDERDYLRRVRVGGGGSRRASGLLRASRDCRAASSSPHASGDGGRRRRLALLRAVLRHRRGSGHRLGALRPRHATGRASSVGPRSSRARSPRAKVCSTCAWTATACTSRARPSRCCAAS